MPSLIHGIYHRQNPGKKSRLLNMHQFIQLAIRYDRGVQRNTMACLGPGVKQISFRAGLHDAKKLNLCENLRYPVATM